MIKIVEISTRGKGLIEVTGKINSVLQQSRMDQGLITVFIQHTSASLLIQENADPSVLNDLEHWMDRIVPENDSLYTHTMEGPDDMPAHIKSMLTQSSLSIPFVNGSLALGTWQGIFIWEHRDKIRRRKIIVHVQPDQ